MTSPITNGNDLQTPSCHTGCYPAGAFLVPDKRSLGPLVLDLRQAQRLKKSTRNVTGFDPAYVLVLPAGRTATMTENEQGTAEAQLQHHYLYVSKAQTVWEAAATAEKEEGECGVSCLQRRLAAQLNTLQAQEEVLPFVTLPPAEQTAPVMQLLSRWSHPTAEQTATLTAVHVTGTLTPACVAHYLSGAYLPPQGDGKAGAASRPQPPVAFVYFLRAYSRPCYTAAELARLPLPHQQLLRAGTQLQTPAPPPPPPSAAAPHDAGSFSFTELFGGIGMFRAGLEAAGGTAALAVEMALPAVTVYNGNFPPRPGTTDGLLWAGDLTELPSYLLPRRHDLLSAGFPCQSFAKAGPALGLQMQHGQLFYEVVRVLRACQPASFLLENVANLVEVEEGRQLAEILRWLRCPFTETAAPPLYMVQYQVLEGGRVSPQSRRRVYFVGVRCDVPLRHQTEGRERAVYLDEVFQRVEDKLEQLRNAAATTSGMEIAAAHHLPSVTVPSTSFAGTTTHVLYPTVAEMLLSSHAWQPSAPAVPPDGCYAPLTSYLRSLHLSRSQWEALARTQSFRQHPSWRIADLRGHARTLMGSYRTSYQLYSEFVPVDTKEVDIEAAVQRLLATVATRDDSRHRHTHEEGEEEEDDKSSDSFFSSSISSFTSPLRFFAPRECARLQGIADRFQLMIPQEQPYFDTLDRKKEHEQGAKGLKSLSEGSIYKLIGNAVNPIVIECIAKSLREVFVIGDTRAPHVPCTV